MLTKTDSIYPRMYVRTLYTLDTYLIPLKICNISLFFIRSPTSLKVGVSSW